MVEEPKNAPAEEDKQSVLANPEADASQEEKKETVGEVLKTEENPPQKGKDPRFVPEAVLLEYKSQNRELKRDLKELKTLIEQGASKKDISSQLKEIAEDHNVDIDFLNKLSSSIKEQVETEIEERFSSKIKPIEEKERQEKMNKAFEEHYSKALSEMPEFNGVADKEVIRQLSLNPANRNKTFLQILEETYGKFIKGKRTMEKTKPRGGASQDEYVDFQRAARDGEYFKEIMADPVLKRKYNEDLGKRLRL